MAQKKISVIVPAFNEESIIQSTANEIVKYLEENLPEAYSWELILVNDGSLDNTGKLMEDTCARIDQVKVVHHPTNFGRGKAIKTGFHGASGAVLICLDADLSYSPDHILKMLQKLEETDADIVLASCYAPEGKVENVPFSRALFSKIGNKLFSIAFNNKITTITCVVRAYKADAIKSMDLVSDGKDLHPEILFKAQLIGLKIQEIPATLKWKENKLSKTSKQKKRKSKFILSQTTATHLFLLFWARPFLMFLIPGVLLLMVATFEFGVLIYHFVRIYVDLQDFSLAWHKLLSEFTLTFAVVGGAILLGFQVFSLGFISMLAQRNFAELYRLVHRSSLRNRE